MEQNTSMINNKLFRDTIVGVLSWIVALVITFTKASAHGLTAADVIIPGMFAAFGTVLVLKSIKKDKYRYFEDVVEQ